MSDPAGNTDALSDVTGETDVAADPAGNTDALNDVLAGETDVAGDLAGKSDAPSGNTDALNDVPSKTAVQTDVAGIMTGRLRSSPLLKGPRPLGFLTMWPPEQFS